MAFDPIIDKLTTARVGLLLKAPFFGNMATRMQLIDASEWCPTAATNGRNFYYNKKFIEKLSVKKLEFLFGHEICHCVFDHFGRVGSRDRQLSNIAQDYAVNQILVDTSGNWSFTPQALARPSPARSSDRVNRGQK